MKLSFSTRGWADHSWDELVSTALEMDFSGIEIHNPITNAAFTGKGGPLDRYNTQATARALRDKGLSIPAFDSSVDISAGEQQVQDAKDLIDLAQAASVGMVCVVVQHDDEDAIHAALSQLVPYAEEHGVVLLIESSGIFSSTSRLTDIMDRYASDYLGALWDVHNVYRVGGESPATTIKNLGAYVKHVHMRDSDDDGSFNLVGEGTLPIDEVVRALSSIDYDGFVSLEWDPAWMADLTDMEVIFPHYVNYMEQFEDTRGKRRTLYLNHDGTGEYVWKKDELIDLTFPQVLDKMVECFPDQYCFKYTTLDYTRTYEEFRDDVDTFARALVSMGVKPGSKVAIWATNVPAWYITFWAATKIGAVLVTVNTAYKIHEAEYLLRQSDTHTLVMIKGYRDSHYDEIMKELCPELETATPGKPLACRRLPFLRNIITVDFRMKGCLTWEEAVARAHMTPLEEVHRLAAAVDIHDVCNMQYTSGTTGFPKGVMLTHYNVVNNGKCIGDRMDLSTEDRMMIQVPMFHCFGMVLAMTAAMTHGTTLSPLPYFSTKASLACINQEHITCFHGVPTMFIAMMEHEDFAKTDFSYMRTGIMAGSPCPIAKMRDVVNKMNMKEIVIVYGQTEASPGCTMSDTGDSLEVRVETVGHALPEIECRIVDPETNEEVPDNVNGEFVARGYNIMKGYYKMPEATAAAIDKDGWLHTGDLACRTPDGNYKITGRLKDMIIRGGENIYPQELEEFLYTHPKVKDVQVIGVPDEALGEEICACIVLKDGETATEKEIKDYFLANMARHKCPKYVDFVEAFPMNAAGKILKYKMRENAVEKYGLQKAASVKTA